MYEIYFPRFSPETCSGSAVINGIVEKWTGRPRYRPDAYMTRFKSNVV